MARVRSGLSCVNKAHLSAKNPANIKEIIHRAPNEIMEDIIRTNTNIYQQLDNLQAILKK